MKNTIKALGIIVLVTVIGLSMTACPTEDNGGGGGNDDGGGGSGGIPAISEGTTGRATITGNNITLLSRSPADKYINTSGITIPQSQMFCENCWWKVSNGKLSFSLGTPPSSILEIIGELLSAFGGWFYGNSSESVTASNPYALAMVWNGSGYYNGQEYFDVSRAVYGESTFITIIYVYVNADTTLSRRKISSSDSTHAAFSLPLKAGWNLIQIEASLTQSGDREEVYSESKIADKNVPWTISSWE
jgi:hypothetical protein